MNRRSDYCNTCKFWFPQVGGSGQGECRRYPPAHAYEPQGRAGRVSPVTGAYFWCGEHQSSGEKIGTAQDSVADAFFSQQTDR